MLWTCEHVRFHRKQLPANSNQDYLSAEQAISLAEESSEVSELVVNGVLAGRPHVKDEHVFNIQMAFSQSHSLVAEWESSCHGLRSFPEPVPQCRSTLALSF